MKLVEKITSKSELETENFAKSLLNTLTPGSIIELQGNLGTGKTFFVKAFSKLLGIDNASSPSFAIVNEYYGKCRIIHFDFYRLKKINELYDIGFEEYINDLESIIFIEWGNLFEEVLPRKRYKILFELNENGTRSIKLYESR
jgi:tRNA threonylcarbamoyladenosine biosynthesis protein TsaE